MVLPCVCDTQGGLAIFSAFMLPVLSFPSNLLQSLHLPFCRPSSISSICQSRWSFSYPRTSGPFSKTVLHFSFLPPTSPDLLLQLVKGQRAIILIQRFTNPLAKSKKLSIFFTGLSGSFSVPFSRLGIPEERDAHRLRDKNGVPVLCFQCGVSALPSGLAATAPATKRTRRSSARGGSDDIWKPIISCDFCNLHWHLDCIDPPLPSLPPINKRWMCPNHSDRVLVWSKSFCALKADGLIKYSPYSPSNAEFLNPTLTQSLKLIAQASPITETSRSFLLKMPFPFNKSAVWPPMKS